MCCTTKGLSVHKWDASLFQTGLSSKGDFSPISFSTALISDLWLEIRDSLIPYILQWNFRNTSTRATEGLEMSHCHGRDFKGEETGGKTAVIPKHPSQWEKEKKKERGKESEGVERTRQKHHPTVIRLILMVRVRHETLWTMSSKLLTWHHSLSPSTPAGSSTDLPVCTAPTLPVMWSPIPTKAWASLPRLLQELPITGCVAGIPAPAPHLETSADGLDLVEMGMKCPSLLMISTLKMQGFCFL